jgi:hypothetical protein
MLCFGRMRAAATDMPTAQAAATTPRPRIVNGVLTFSHPSAGALLLYDDVGATTLYGLCSGTLIGCRTFLTAAHCVCLDDADDATACKRAGTVSPDALRVFLQHGGIFTVAHLTVSPEYSFAERGDIAVLTLGEPVRGVAPSGINTSSRPEVGTVGTIVGFGTTAPRPRSAADAGIKRRGAVVTAPCPDDIPDETHICWEFLGSGSNTCEGDSGGPFFLTLGSSSVLAGVTSGGLGFDCVAPSVAFDTDVFVNRSWIAAVAGDDLGIERCGLPAAGTETTATFTSSGQLDRANPEAPLEFEVPEGTALLRVGLNGQLSSSSGFFGTSNDFDLLVRAGSAPSPDAYDCSAIDSTPFGFCEIDSPRAGPWHVVVRLIQGEGTFQVTATTFAAASPAPCTGDCSGDGTVTVDEILKGVGIALGNADLATCAAVNANNDDVVTIDEVLAAVTSVLTGCTAL